MSIHVASIGVVKRERMIQFKFIRADSRRPMVIDFFKEVAADGAFLLKKVRRKSISDDIL